MVWVGEIQYVNLGLLVILSQPISSQDICANRRPRSYVLSRYHGTTSLVCVCDCTLTAVSTITTDSLSSDKHNGERHRVITTIVVYYNYGGVVFRHSIVYCIERCGNINSFRGRSHAATRLWGCLATVSHKKVVARTILWLVDRDR